VLGQLDQKLYIVSRIHQAIENSGAKRRNSLVIN